MFADDFLRHRLPHDPAWSIDPGPAFTSIRTRIDHPATLAHTSLAAATKQLYEPLWSLLGFQWTAVQRPTHAIAPDYRLADSMGVTRTIAIIYPWQRWLDGPDPNDPERPAENPSAAVLSLLDKGDADWAIVTNGKLWRLYSRTAHSRSTNFYEVDLEDALKPGTATQPREAFRYWLLFFRVEAFLPSAHGPTWLDSLAQASREYTRAAESALKKQIFRDVVPMLANGFLHDRQTRLRNTSTPSPEELEHIRAGATTLLYRILFVLYAEGRDLLPTRNDAYARISLKRLKEEVAEAAGPVRSQTGEKLDAKFSRLSTSLYDRLASPIPNKKDGTHPSLFHCLSVGQPTTNIPKYTGNLFRLDPSRSSAASEANVCTFLNEHKVPDFFLASAIDRLSRVEDSKTRKLTFVNHKSLSVRQLGSIYEGLLEFQLRIANDNPTHQRRAFLHRTNTKRKTSGSYYTPDHIVEYVVRSAVGPVLRSKLDALRAEFNSRSHEQHQDLIDKLFDLKVLDPAMGSGHFLVEAVDFITDELLIFLSAFPDNPVSATIKETRRAILTSLAEQGIQSNDNPFPSLSDAHLLKRLVLKRCIFGVDLDPFATELAKVSLWLDTCTQGMPLPFLDHHLRTGNSLLGSALSDLERAFPENPIKNNALELSQAVQSQLRVQHTFDVSASEVADSKHAFDSARTTLAGHRVLLDILTASHFEHKSALQLLEHSRKLALPFSRNLFDNLAPKHKRTLDAVRALSKSRSFFHWELEFPEVAFPPAANERIGAAQSSCSSQAGFDVVIGNPPFLNQLESKTVHSPSELALLRSSFGLAAKGYADTSALLLLRGVSLLRNDGIAAMVQPQSLLAARDASGIRDYCWNTADLIELWVAGERVFEEATVFVCIPFLRKPASTTWQLERRSGAATQKHGPKTLNRDSHRPGDTWMPFIADALGIPLVTVTTHKHIGDVADVTADFRDQYYGLRGMIVDAPEISDGSWPKLLTTGLVDLAHCKWGRTPTRFDGAKWQRPLVNLAKLRCETNLGPWADRRLVPKVLVATQTSIIEAIVDDKAEWLPSVPLLSAMPHSSIDVWLLAAAIAAPPIAAIALHKFAGTGLTSDVIKLSASQLADMPFPDDLESLRRAAALFKQAQHEHTSDARDATLLRYAAEATRAFGIDLAQAAPLIKWWWQRHTPVAATSNL